MKEKNHKYILVFSIHMLKIRFWLEIIFVFLPTYMSVHNMHACWPQRPADSVVYSGLGITDSCKWSRGC